MRNQRFGIEIEMTGITRASAANVIAGYFHTTARHIEGIYDTYTIRSEDNRQWKLVKDGSIQCENRRGSTDNEVYSVEFVSPICRYEDIPIIQDLVRQLRHNGAKVNDSCGIHVHVDASLHSVQTLRNLVNIIAAKEDLLYKALRVKVTRQKYCKKVNAKFLDVLNHVRPKTMNRLEAMWYNGATDNRHEHYNSTRYHALNLHSVFTKGTVEFRMFNSTLHAGEVKSYIQLCLAINHQALIQKGASHIRTQSTNEKYTFRTWLLRLGLIGDEFKTARQHLLKNLDGNIAWRDPAQAEAQRERLVARQREETIQSEERTEDISPPVQETAPEEEVSSLVLSM